MDAVRDQRGGIGDQADNDLGHRKQQVYPTADQSDLARLTATLGAFCIYLCLRMMVAVLHGDSVCVLADAQGDEILAVGGFRGDQLVPVDTAPGRDI